MTTSKSRGSRAHRLLGYAKGRGGQICLLLLGGLVLFALRDADLLARTVSDALSLCVRQVIPVLFPIAAAGGLLTCFAAPPAFLCRPIGRLFRLSDASVGVLVIALVSGFPIGAMLASRLLEAGRIGREEASRLACYTNNASAAFLTGCVGARFFGDRRIGWMLWIASTAAALTVGILMARRTPHPAPNEAKDRTLPTPAALAQSLKATGQGMLNLTVFVVFFAVFRAFLDRALIALLPSGELSALVQAVTAAFFEITGGLAAVADLSLLLPLRMGLAGAAAGFGGISVFMQCMAAGSAVQGDRLLKARLVIGLLSGIFAVLLSFAL
ncbi:MAG: hypothetical protein IJX76_04885 [Clostridia bacterium]|nr:hypothetical protein [Clostridia bacterium]